MEIKLPGTENREQQYFDELLARIREIRASERTPKQKVADIVSCAVDYDKEDAIPLLTLLNSRMSALGTNGDLRFANCMLMSVERWAANHHPLTMKSIEEQQRYWLMDADNNQHIYEYPSFSGIYEEEDADEEEEGFLVPESTVRLPKELEDFKGSSMILKLEDMDRFIDTFCSRNTYYRRAYDILHELDKRVLESLEADSQYRTLYVVYRYDTTAS